MQKILGDAFAEKCAKLLRQPEANIHSVARRLGCSASTVYRATGGKKRVEAGSTVRWVEDTRKARTTTGRKNRNKAQAKLPKAKSKRTGDPKHPMSARSRARRASEAAARI